MQRRCEKIAIVRRTVRRIQDRAMREICELLMNGFSREYVRKTLNMPKAVFEMFLDEIKRLLLEAGLELRDA